MIRTFIIASLLVFKSFVTCPQPTISFQPIVSGLSGPVDVVEEKNASKRLFVVEQAGTIRIVTGNAFLPTPFLNVSSVITAGGERGLLSLAFHPDYATNGYFFIWYNNRPNGDVTLARYTRSATSPDSADPASGVVLLNIAKRFSNHNGAKLNFGSDGYLYFGTGDGGSGGDPDFNAQDSTRLLGKLLRIDVNNPNSPYYSIPPTNPFANSNTVRKEIIGLGMRNPWRWSFDKATGDIWLADVGQNLWEEVNFVPAASRLNKNFGWNCLEATHSFNSGCSIAANNVIPVFEYGHDNNNGGFSITGGYVYRGTEYPSLQGYYMFTDYVSGNGWLTRPNGSGGFTTTLQKNWISNITSFGEASDGTLYIVSSNGTLYKIIASEVLPVKLVSFFASVAGSNHQISWTVANEQAGDEYIIEKRTDPTQPFTKIESVVANSSINSKNYIVRLPADDKSAWYRLQIKSLQGGSTYSSVVNLIKQGASSFKAVIISNTLQVTLPPKAKTINVYDNNGKLLLSKPVTNSVAERISLANISRGVLAVQVQTADAAETVKLLY